MLVDKMLATCAEIETWREKKESQDAQARHNDRKRKAHDRYDDYGMGFSYGIK